jgi:hypothetical protein
MKFLEPEEVKKSLQRYKLFDPNSVLRKIDSIIEENIRNVRAGNKKNKIYNPYLSSYLLLLTYKTYVIAGINKMALII